MRNADWILIVGAPLVASVVALGVARGLATQPPSAPTVSPLGIDSGASLPPRVNRGLVTEQVAPLRVDSEPSVREVEPAASQGPETVEEVADWRREQRHRMQGEALEAMRSRHEEWDLDAQPFSALLEAAVDAQADERRVAESEGDEAF